MKAELITHSGSDLLVVNAARVSFDKESEWDLIDKVDEHGAYQDYLLSPKDVKLIKYLTTHNHFTPFTHCMITLRETVPIFVARQRFKHTVGFTYNEVSRRYVDDKPVLYHPKVWRTKAENKKQGSGGPHPTWNHGVGTGYLEHYYEVMDEVIGLYDRMIDLGVAPEQARIILPQSMYTSYYVTGSLSAFARAYKLRSQEDAQVEIQELAKEWDRIIRSLYPVSWENLVND